MATGGRLGKIVVRALGASEIVVAHRRVKPAASKKFAFLLILTAEPGRRVPRGQLQELLFPGVSDRNARHALRELVYQLRRSGALVETDKAGVGLAAGAVRSDYSEVIGAKELTASQVRAVEGGLLPGYAPDHSEALVEWYEGFRTRLVVDLCRRLVREIHRAKQEGDWEATELAARACLALDQLHEEATLSLAEVYAIGGSKQTALDLLEKYEMEVGPSNGLRLPAATLSRRIAERLPAAPPARMPLLGRQAESKTLAARLAMARHGTPDFVSVIGEAGIGKTRLLEEFGHTASVLGATVLNARFLAHDVARPYSAFADLVPSLLRCRGALGCSPDNLATLRRLSGTDGVGAEGTEEPRSEFGQIVAATQDLLDALTAESLLVLLLDDAQWIDPASRSLFGALSRSGDRPLLVVASSRGHPAFGGLGLGSQHSVVPLRPLPDEVVRAYVDAKLPTERADVKTWLGSVSHGNPLFLEILLRHIAAGNAADKAPPALIALLQAQLRELSNEARSVLLMACLLGRHATPRRLYSVMGDQSGRGLIGATGELGDLGLLRLQSDGTVFPHPVVATAVIQETADITLNFARRRVAELLEADAASAGPSLAWDAAQHWADAGEPGRASVLVESCARQAIRLERANEGARLLRRAAELSEEPRRKQLLTEAARWAAFAGEHDLLLDLTDLLRRTGWVPQHDEVELAEILVRAAWRNQIPESDRLLQCRLAPAASEAHRRSAALTLLRVADLQRDVELAAEAMEVLFPVLNEPSDRHFQLTAALTYHATFGDAARGLAFAEQALALAGELTPIAAAEIQRLAGVAMLRAGDAQSAMRAWTESFESARSCDSTRMQFETAILLLTTATDLGRDEEAAFWQRSAEVLIAIRPELADAIPWLAHRSDRALAQHDVAELTACLRGAATFDTVHANRRFTRWYRALQLSIDALSGRITDAPAAAREILSMQSEGLEMGDVGDFEIATIVVIYQRAGLIAEARLIVDEYLANFRRARSPLWSSLREALRAISQEGSNGL